MVALDVDELSEAKKIVEELKGLNVTFKVGNQLGTYEGWSKVIEYIHSKNAKIFCDTKFKDIPETVRKSSRAITRHSPDFFNVMADNTQDALEAAVSGMASVSGIAPILLGVTVLTTINDEECRSIYGGDVITKAQQFAGSAALAGLDGVVCSAQEAALLRANENTADLILVTPGIRPVWAPSNDQKRIVTPSDAVQAGADYLVIGRPITEPPTEIGSSREAVLKIIEELEGIS
jgi:orotidine-5'-phosphate decarboxylase